MNVPGISRWTGKDCGRKVTLDFYSLQGRSTGSRVSCDIYIKQKLYRLGPRRYAPAGLLQLHPEGMSICVPARSVRVVSVSDFLPFGYLLLLSLLQLHFCLLGRSAESHSLRRAGRARNLSARFIRPVGPSDRWARAIGLAQLRLWARQDETNINVL